MKKGTIISIGLLVLGFVFECLYMGTDKTFFVIKFWLLGVFCMIAGALGLVWFTLIPLAEKRAETMGKAKKKSFLDKDK